MDSVWQRPGGTLSDKTARKEFGLTQEEIVRAIRVGEFHLRCNWSYGNPYLRLLRREVEALVKKKHGGRYVREQQLKTQLALVNRDLRRLKTQIDALEERRAKLMADQTATAGTGQARVRAAARRQPRRTARSNPKSARRRQPLWSE